jgi:hypothetical protein
MGPSKPEMAIGVGGAEKNWLKTVSARTRLVISTLAPTAGRARRYRSSSPRVADSL